MERGYLETIQLLGLDVELAVVVVLLALVPAARLIVRLADGVGQDRVPPAQSVRRAARPARPPAADPWSPAEWRPSH
jgi:hypothetical protein